MQHEWWKNASGIMTHDSDEFQKLVDEAGSEKLVIVDFFMPQCGYCVKFMPDWNRVVEDIKAEFGDKVQFLKVDGIHDRYTSDRYDVNSFPSFIALEPGSHGDKWTDFHANRTHSNMKRWIKTLASKFHIEAPSATGGKATDNAAANLQNNHALGAPLPLAAGQPSADFFKQQVEESHRMSDAIN